MSGRAVENVLELSVDESWQPSITRVLGWDVHNVLLIGGTDERLHGAVNMLDEVGVPSLRMPPGKGRGRVAVRASGSFNVQTP